MARPKLLVAFDANAVCGAVVSRRLRGPQLESVARVPLAAGALVPSAFDSNLARAEEVRGALTRLRQSLGGSVSGATLVLPDGIARIVLVEPEGGADPREYARFRFASSLPYAAREAVVDVLAVGGGRFLAAAVRRPVVEGYEAAAAASGFGQEGVDLAPLAAIAGLLRRPPGAAAAVDIILGDAAVSLAAFRQGALRVFRTRRRDPGGDEAERLRDEADRTAALAGDGAPPRIRVSGRGAREMLQALTARGGEAELAAVVPAAGSAEEAAELAWLGAALA